MSASVLQRPRNRVDIGPTLGQWLVTEDRRLYYCRPEHAGDWPAIHEVQASAFPTDAEARLVDAMRGRRPACDFDRGL